VHDGEHLKLELEKNSGCASAVHLVAEVKVYKGDSWVTLMIALSEMNGSLKEA
jgi:hypothetical protein